LVELTVHSTGPVKNREIMPGVYPSGELPPAASPVFRKGWLSGAAYVLEALAAGTPADEVIIVIGVVKEEAKPKKRGFRRRRKENS
jgi:hypothetical protein